MTRRRDVSGNSRTGQGGAQGIFLFTQMAGNQDIEVGLSWPRCLGWQWPRRLDYGIQASVKTRREIVADTIMQTDKRIGAHDTVVEYFWMAMLKAVHIRTGQRHDQGPPGKGFMEGADRFMATPGMQRDHQIRRDTIPVPGFRVALGHMNMASQDPQLLCPAYRGSAIASPRATTSRGDQ
jgi:hypothetical protein